MLVSRAMTRSEAREYGLWMLSKHTGRDPRPHRKMAPEGIEAVDFHGPHRIPGLHFADAHARVGVRGARFPSTSFRSKPIRM